MNDTSPPSSSNGPGLGAGAVFIPWRKISDEELLKVRICDLPIQIEGSGLEERIQKVYDEMEERGLYIRPTVYLADEWFSPEGDPVVGIPFYLAHPRLRRLERKMMLEAEGEERAEFLQLLRHEMGHAVSHSYRLWKRPSYIRTFGRSSDDFPDGFRPRPYSRQYVQHLKNCYAQTHPDEDFAETFAVWLTPHLDWRKRYKGWGALRKLEIIDRLMREVGGQPPKRRTGEKMSRLSTLRYPLSTYYRRKRKLYQEDFPDFFDRDLLAIFSAEADGKKPSASRFLRQHREMLVRSIAKWTTERRYTVNDLFSQFVNRCQDLGLRVILPEDETLARTTACLTSMASNYFLTGHFKRLR